jgi:NADPH:quinone reductase-like Zn-dependent oxidoreductase
MRAAVVTRFGGPEVLEAREVPHPVCLPTEVLLRVASAGTNPVELAIRAGRHALLGPPPFILGWDVSGVVEEVAPGMHRFEPGDEIFGFPMFPREVGGYSEYAAVPSRQMVRKPEGMSHEQAAALPMAGLTAWQGLVDTAKMKCGDRVLIHSGGGGVGHLAVQIAKAVGAYVIATASAGKRDYVLRLGADEVVPYDEVEFEHATADIDIVLELVGGDYPTRSFTVMKPGGILVSGVDRARPDIWKQAAQAGVRFAGIIVEPDQVGLDALVDLFERHLLRIDVQETFPLDRAADAHAALESGHTRGKIVLVP